MRPDSLLRANRPVTAGRKAKGLGNDRDSQAARGDSVPWPREREMEFASLTLGSRAHNVWQAITPWGNPGGFSFLVHFDDLIPPCPDTDISHGRSCQVLQPVHVCSGGRRQVGESPSLRQLLLPPLQRLVYRLHSLDPLQIRG